MQKENNTNSIWTEEENDERCMNNLLNTKGKSCANCHWSGYKENDMFVTCGHHLENFTPNSYCSYWTTINDRKILEHNHNRRQAIKDKLETKAWKR